MCHSNNKTEGLVWVADQINQSEVEFTPRYLIHNRHEHRIYFHSEKPATAPPQVDQLLEALTRPINLKISAPTETSHAKVKRERSNSFTGLNATSRLQPTTPGVTKRPSFSKRLKLTRASSLSEKKTDVRRLKDTSRHFKSLDALEDVGVLLGLPGSVLELQKDPSPSISVVHTSLMSRLIFTYCLRISIPPTSNHSDGDESKECVGNYGGKSLYVALQTENDMYRWLHSLAADLERVRNRRFHVYPTLTVTISEAKGVPSKKPLFCEILLDSVPFARTNEKLSNKASVFWGEKLEFSEFIPIQFLNVLVLKGKAKRPHELGRIEVPAMTLYGKGPVEKWYTLKLERERRKTLMSIRIKIHYQVLNILPFTKYEDLLNYVTDDYLVIISNLAPQLPVKKKDPLAKNLVRMFYSTGDVTRYLVDVVVAEVSDTSDSNLIFRGNSLATKSMDYYMQLVANHYLQNVLKRPIARLLQDTMECEVDPERIPSTTTPLQAQNHFLRHLHTIWEAIYKSRSSIPPELQIVFHGIQTELGPEKQSISNTVIIACIFLRFFCASIMSPSLFEIVKEYPCERDTRKLTLVAKVLQTLANNSRFESKESHLLFINGWVEREVGRMAEFISYVAGFSWGEKRDSVAVDLSVSCKLPQMVSLGFELSTLHHFLSEFIDSNNNLELLYPLKILLDALTQIEAAFNESKDKFLWITATPEKCVASVGIGAYYQEAVPLCHFTSLESESTGSGDEDLSSDLENGRPQVVPQTDLTWSKRDVISYRESISTKSSARSSSEDEPWPLPPWRVASFNEPRETRDLYSFQNPRETRDLYSFQNPRENRDVSNFRDTRETKDAFQRLAPNPVRTLSPIDHLNDNSTIADIENCLEAVQRSFNLTPQEPPKPFIRRTSPNQSRNYSQNNAIPPPKLSPSKSANQLQFLAVSPSQTSPPVTTHNLSQHLSVETSFRRFKQTNEIRRNTSVKVDHIPTLNHSQSDSGNAPSNQKNFRNARKQGVSQSFNNHSMKFSIPMDKSDSVPSLAAMSHMLPGSKNRHKLGVRYPGNESLQRSISNQTIPNSSSPPPPAVPPRFTKASSAEIPVPMSPQDPATPLNKWPSDGEMPEPPALPQRPSHPPKTIEVSQSLDRISGAGKSHLSKLTGTFGIGHEKLERKWSMFSGASPSEDDYAYYKKECTRMQKELTKARAENQELSGNLVAKQKEVDKWRALSTQQAKELKSARDTSEIVSLNHQAQGLQAEVCRLKIENEEFRKAKVSNSDTLKAQIETWKGLAMERLTRIRCLENSNATLMNGISQLETLQNIMTNGDLSD